MEVLTNDEMLKPLLLAILDDREMLYDDLTQQAFTCITPKLTNSVNACIEMTENVEWVSIEYVENMEGFLRVLGLCPVGSENGNEEDILSDVRRMIRLVLPIKLLLDGTQEELTLFIEELGLVAAVANEEQLRMILTEYYTEDLRKLSNNKKYNDLVTIKQNDKSSEKEDFDIKLLTEKQSKSLIKAHNTRH